MKVIKKQKSYRYFSIYKWIGVFAFTFLFVFGGCFLARHLKITEAQTVSYDLAGWLWTDNYGWISLSSDNCLLANQQENPDPCDVYGQDYKVVLNADNSISGWGWSENIGWVCFGDTCYGQSGGIGFPPGEPALPWASLDESTGKITGWASVISLGVDGWLKLGRGQTKTGSIGQDCFDCKQKCLIWTMKGDPAVSVPPCLQYSETEYEDCAICFTKTCFGESIGGTSGLPDSNCDKEHQWPQELAGDDPVVEGSGDICVGQRIDSGPIPNCPNCCTDCVRSPLTGDSYRIKCNNCPSCEEYGVGVNLGSGSLLGWGWNGQVNKMAGGAGWVHFNSIGGAMVIYPWLETKFGAIYTSKDVRQRAGALSNNATYCIFADDIEHIKTVNCKNEVIGGVDILFPSSSSSGIYRNALGRIDVDSLVAKVSNDLNIYGNKVKEISSLGDINAGVLDNTVYYAPNNLNISNTFTFNNAPAGNNQRGNGLIVVNGDLVIGDNLYYSPGLPVNDDLKKLASVAWIVKGDIIIDPAAINVVGAFIVLGNGRNNCEDDGGEYPRYTQNGCGVFYSGESGNNLTVAGLIVAKAFDFRRFYASLKTGSERIIYDGRLVANPPPGMKGFIEGLPVIRDFSY